MRFNSCEGFSRSLLIRSQASYRRKLEKWPCHVAVIKKKPDLYRVWSSHMSRISLLTEFDKVKYVFGQVWPGFERVLQQSGKANESQDLNRTVDLVRNVTLLGIGPSV